MLEFLILKLRLFRICYQGTENQILGKEASTNGCDEDVESQTQEKRLQQLLGDQTNDDQEEEILEDHERILQEVEYRIGLKYEESCTQTMTRMLYHTIFDIVKQILKFYQ